MLMSDAKEHIKRHADIVQIAEEHGISVRKTGSVYKGLCPFHDEKTPSFTVYPNTQSFYCFGCGKSGDVYSLIMENKKVPFKEALSILAKRYNVEITSSNKDHSAKTTPVSEIAKLYNKAYSLSREVIMSNKGAAVVNYLKSRGFDESIINNTDIGVYTPDVKKSISEFCSNKEMLIKSGLISWGMGFNYQIFLPQHDQYGNVIGFIVRLVNDGFYPDGKPLPKYKFSSGYNKDLPFNFYSCISTAIHEAKRKKEIIVTEGVMDCLSFKASDIRNVVAIGGWSLSKENIELFKKCNIEKICLALDNDDAGSKGIVEAIKLLLEYPSIIPFVVVIPKPFKDISDFYKACHGDKPQERLKSLLKDVHLGWIYLAEQMGDQAKSDKDKLMAIDESKKIYTKIPSEFGKTAFIKAFAKSIGITIPALKKTYGATDTKKNSSEKIKALLKRIESMLNNGSNLYDMHETVREFFRENAKKISHVEKSIISTVNNMLNAYAIDDLKAFIQKEITVLNK